MVWEDFGADGHGIRRQLGSILIASSVHNDNYDDDNDEDNDNYGDSSLLLWSQRQ